jgi:alpha-galactosidase
MPPVSFNSWFGLHLSTSEKALKPHIDAAARMGIEYFVQDAGWYDGSLLEGAEFMNGAGNWRRENPKKFPNGLKAVANYVERKGMKFGLWWAPENCDAESELGKQHADWLLPLKPGDPSPTGSYCLVDFGKAEAVEWFKDTIDRMISRYKIRWLRWDLNIYPALCWNRADPPDRRGITQIRHIQGLLELWDHVLKNHPQVCIEACCGGGRRMDLGCLRRAHSYWCNDMTKDPLLQRYENTGANTFITPNFLNRNILYRGEEGYPAEYYHGLMGGCLGFGDPLTTWNDLAIKQAAEHIAVFKRIRNLLMADYRPLFGQRHSMDDWDGWQFHDETCGSGVLVVFRCRSDTSEKRIPLKWLSKERRYTFTDPYHEIKETYGGLELTREGLAIQLPEPSDSILLAYESTTSK